LTTGRGVNRSDGEAERREDVVLSQRVRSDNSRSWADYGEALVKALNDGASGAYGEDGAEDT
jgi:hypothetical protein